MWYKFFFLILCSVKRIPSWMNTYFLHNPPPPLPVLQSGTVQLFNGVADPSMGSTHHAWAFALLCCNLQKEPGEPGAHPFPLLLRAWNSREQQPSRGPASMRRPMHSLQAQNWARRRHCRPVPGSFCSHKGSQLCILIQEHSRRMRGRGWLKKKERMKCWQGISEIFFKKENYRCNSQLMSAFLWKIILTNNTTTKNRDKVP